MLKAFEQHAASLLLVNHTPQEIVSSSHFTPSITIPVQSRDTIIYVGIDNAHIAVESKNIDIWSVEPPYSLFNSIECEHFKNMEAVGDNYLAILTKGDKHNIIVVNWRNSFRIHSILCDETTNIAFSFGYSYFLYYSNSSIKIFDLETQIDVASHDTQYSAYIPYREIYYLCLGEIVHNSRWQLSV
jgi:hypothetical protein